jgi:hypothetical protein
MTLADRIEGLDGPSREVDAEIEKLLPCSPEFARHHPGTSMSQWNERSFRFYSIGDEGHEYISPPYTASLDAALTLVPEGLYPIIDFVTARVFLRTKEGYDPPCGPCYGFGKTVSNSIVAAALRAQEAEGRGR